MKWTGKGTGKLLLLLSSVLAGNAWAVEKPLWEAGAGIGVVSMPDYRGADQSHSYALPIPYLVYRGDFLQVDRQKIRGLLFSRDWGELDVSLNGSIPVKSDQNTARRGMPSLDPTLEIGPQLNVFLSKGARHDLQLRLPVRMVEAMDGLHGRPVGHIFSPVLNLDLYPGNNWNIGVSGGPVWGDTAYHNYFYTVEPQYATADRPAYQAHGGYAGAQFIVSASKRFDHMWFGAYIKDDDLNGAAFLDSPLVKRHYGFSAGFGVSWIFAESGRRVSVAEPFSAMPSER